MRVALEATGCNGVERVLAVVAVRRVADVVGQAGHFAQVGVQAEPGADTAGDLRDLERMRQARARRVPVAGADDLRFVGKPAQRRGVQHARTVTLEGVARLVAGRKLRLLRGLGNAARHVVGVVGVHDI